MSICKGDDNIYIFILALLGAIIGAFMEGDVDVYRIVVDNEEEVANTFQEAILLAMNLLKEGKSVIIYRGNEILYSDTGFNPNYKILLEVV